MKTKYYSNGQYKFRAYMKPVGEGYEVGFYSGKTPVFVGNFIHSKEATQWYAIMNRQIRQFSKRYTVGPKFPVNWYMHFAKNHLYKCYYGYLDRLFARYNREYDTAYKRDVRRYNRMKKNWSYRKPLFKAA